MIIFSYVKYSKSKDKDIYDIRFPLSGKGKIINDNYLDFKYREKVYFLNNVIIKINPDGTFFNYENDISIDVNDDFIVRGYDTMSCPKFNFYRSDLEEDYMLYENKDSSIKLKEYNDYYTFETITK